jgi:AcrR family transcriptional regulator
MTNEIDMFSADQPDGSPQQHERKQPDRRAQRRETRAGRHAELLDVAVKVFYRKGYAESTLQDIADEMGFTKPAIYYYARNKEELLLEIYAQIVRPAIERARLLAGGHGTGAQRFEALIRQHLATFLANIEANAVFEVQRASLSPGARQTVQQLGRQYGTILADVYRQGVADGTLRDVDPIVTVNAVLGMCNAVHRWYHPAGRIGVDQLVDQLFNLLAAGVVLTAPPLSR